MEKFNGLGMCVGNLSRLSDAKSRSISAENFGGEVGGGAKGCPSDTSLTGSGAARDLGQGWKVSPSISLAPGTERTIAEIDGPGVVQSMWFAGTTDYTMILSIYWDGQETPSVEVPISAFFGQLLGDEINEDGDSSILNSVMVMAAPKQGFSCYWEMPFRRHCKMTIRNSGRNEAIFFYQINYTLTDVPEDCAYFHAQYRQSRPIGSGCDHTILDGITAGKGHYIGATIAVRLDGDISVDPLANREVVFRDPKTSSVLSRTGLETYVFGANNWTAGPRGNEKINMYSGRFGGMYQTSVGDKLKENRLLHMYRWHVQDPARFENGIRVTLEALNPETDKSDCTENYMTVAYWYQMLPTAEFPPLPSLEEMEK